ncbi:MULTISPECIES: TetR family transcriptional regulator [unclassified Lentimonas]|uniref:TetR family transcriptional regulator n=1 Tax=unclassified Lentimonas TaxID=2630993 RepID=UPI0013261BF1|nr:MULTISPECIES: TetR family transcriptional regulator [unclassified Lentimonas]CAA6677291.1 Unannotated [Lentimonas sp. CC4]CAA7180446.1 Unannotated [Lentimonas sp. CC8]CAA6687530.1 Unannotated [Lentimonas sp. CC6]CAA7074537.1 Unannotated [Lentimonas sp. CC4]CAA7169153.1 Unannotated [Lentimonas sp. CC21]
MESKRLIILEVGRKLFLQHGFQGVSMSAVAAAAEVSTEELLVEFESKELLLNRIISEWGVSAIAEIRSDLMKFSSLDSMLILVFDVWIVRPFELIGRSPRASDLFDWSLTGAREAVDANFVRFTELIVEILRSQSESVRHQGMSVPQLAHLLGRSAVGYRTNARDTRELRTLITGLVTLVVR